MLAQWERWAQKPENADKAAEVLQAINLAPAGEGAAAGGGKKKKKKQGAGPGSVANYSAAQQNELVKFIEKQLEEMDAQIKEMQDKWEVEKKELTEQKDQAS